MKLTITEYDAVTRCHTTVDERGVVRRNVDMWTMRPDKSDTPEAMVGRTFMVGNLVPYIKIADEITEVRG